MSSHHNLFKINRATMLKRIEPGELGIIEEAIEAIGKANGWSEATRAGADFIREAGRRLIVEGDTRCKEAGWVYYGLMLLGEHEQIGDGWKVGYTEDILQLIETTGLSEATKQLFRGLTCGRDIHFNATRCECDDVVACFINGDEARVMSEELDASEELRDLPDDELEHVIFNEFSIVLDPDELTPDECFLILTL